MWAGSSDNYDVFLLETDNNGNVSWNQTFGGSNIDRGYSVEQTTDEGYAIVGWNNFSNNGECDVWLIKVAPFENNPPEKPDQPEGPYSGKPETIYSFTGSAVDLNGDQLYYKWDWGDSSTSGWLGPFNSGDPCEISHSWDISGNYEIKMKARDTYWAEGMWSDPLIIEISQEPPNTPTITGPVEGIAGEEYNYTFKSLDPEGNNVFFYIEWGDGDFSDWVGPYHSGETCTLSHTWTDKGSYEIRVKAKDIYGAESNWSVPLGIYRTELTLNIKNNFVSITAEIENTGDYQLNDVDWSFSVTGGILKWINKQQSDTILVLPAGGKEAISSGLIFGLGRITVTVTALDESLTANGLIIGPFIFI